MHEHFHITEVVRISLKEKQLTAVAIRILLCIILESLQDGRNQENPPPQSLRLAADPPRARRRHCLRSDRIFRHDNSASWKANAGSTRSAAG
jgi:hypothetical protein